MREILLKTLYLFILFIGGVAGISQTIIIIPVNQPDQLITTAGTDTTICVNRSIQLHATVEGGEPDYLYLWSPGTGLDNPYITNPVASPDTTTTYTFTVIDNNNCIVSKEITIIIDPCTGIEDTANSFSCELFPNPNTGKFYLEYDYPFSDRVIVRILNIYGQLIWKRIYNPGSMYRIEIDIGDQPEGIYILQLSNNKEILTRRFQIL